jgi:hypothetical protein
MGTEPTIEFEVAKYYTAEEVHGNLLDTYNPRNDRSMSYRVFKKPKDDGTRYYFWSIFLGLYCLWKIENEK